LEFAFCEARTKKVQKKSYPSILQPRKFLFGHRNISIKFLTFLGEALLWNNHVTEKSKKGSLLELLSHSGQKMSTGGGGRRRGRKEKAGGERRREKGEGRERDLLELLSHSGTENGSERWRGRGEGGGLGGGRREEKWKRRKEGRRGGLVVERREIPGQNFVGEHICMIFSEWTLSACIPNFGKPVKQLKKIIPFIIILSPLPPLPSPLPPLIPPSPSSPSSPSSPLPPPSSFSISSSFPLSESRVQIRVGQTLDPICFIPC
jgi:hypothetical protein